MSTPNTIIVQGKGDTVMALTFDSTGVTLAATNPNVNGGQAQTVNIPISTIAKAVGGQVAIGGIEPPLLDKFPTLPPSLLKRMSPTEITTWNQTMAAHRQKDAASIQRWAKITLRPSLLIIATNNPNPSAQQLYGGL